MSKSRMIAVVAMGLLVTHCIPSVSLAAGKLVKVVVKNAKAIAANQAGGKTVEVDAVLTIKNDSDGVTGVSPRSFKYTLVLKGAVDEKDAPHRFFDIKEPNLIDTRPLEPGKSIDLLAPLEGHTIGVAKGDKCLLIVTDPSDEKNTQQIDVTIK